MENRAFIRGMVASESRSDGSAETVDQLLEAVDTGEDIDDLLEAVESGSGIGDLIDAVDTDHVQR